ncbi:MAG TPA: bifunctional methylenetetrahydrofolate dehydrogenase/methenyltetrahydrofolate cyclohydrolase FolD [Eubacteriaceae bacterium]|nr:bifunctional methylenetetrahydrofolate dehydrogenase/methenyltetrahydrofolate cyclohydrolase FolD [Eubacteriaceae bacterium]
MRDKILDGKGLAKDIREKIKAEVNNIKIAKGIVPGLAVVLVGQDPASVSYVSMKERACLEGGFYSEVHRLDEDTSQGEILSLIDELNNNDKIHGILVQLPLPGNIDEKIVNERIEPKKDVDGFNPINLGKLFLKTPGFIPCTPKGIIRLLKHYDISIEGKNAVVVGRSDIVGKPTATLLLHENATVTLCHSRTKNLSSYTKEADILVSAIGKPNFITSSMVKKGAIIIDAGTSKVGNKLVGDVDFQGVIEKVDKITPVPGGVGPMTIAMLLENTLEAVLIK